MKYEVLEVKTQTDFMGLISYLSNGLKLACFIVAIAMIYKYRYVLVLMHSYFSKPKPFERNESFRRQGKQLPPERRKFIRFAEDGTGCNGKAGSLVFKCRWLLVSFLVGFNPVMCES